MNSEIANLFVNKICTIFVNKINRNFDEEQNVNYFVGKILEINKDGILIEHIANKCKSFFYLHSIIGIAEESFIAHESNEKENLNENKSEQRKEETHKKNINIYDSIDNLTDILEK